MAAALRGLARDALVISPRVFGIYAPSIRAAYGSGSVPINDQIISPASLKVNAVAGADVGRADAARRDWCEQPHAPTLDPNILWSEAS